MRLRFRRHRSEREFPSIFLEAQRFARVKVENLAAKDEFELGLHQFRLRPLHACFGIVVVEDRRAAGGGLLLLVAEGFPGRLERARGRQIFLIGCPGIVVRLFDLLAKRLPGFGQRQLLIADGDPLP